MDFYWSSQDVREFQLLWKKGVPLTEIAETFERTETAVLFLAMDRLMKGRIKPRNWKIW